MSGSTFWLAPLLLGTLVVAASAFEVSSPSVSDGKWDKKYLGPICGGRNVSPALSWKDSPAGTKSFVLIVIDPDARNDGEFWHWKVLGIPATTTALPEGAGSQSGKGLPKDAIQGEVGPGRTGYLGPCPLPGSGSHRYVFTIYALTSTPTEAKRDASPNLLGGEVMTKAIGEATIIYKYGR